MSLANRHLPSYLVSPRPTCDQSGSSSVCRAAYNPLRESDVSVCLVRRVLVALCTIIHRLYMRHKHSFTTVSFHTDIVENVAHRPVLWQQVDVSFPETSYDFATCIASDWKTHRVGMYCQSNQRRSHPDRNGSMFHLKLISICPRKHQLWRHEFLNGLYAADHHRTSTLSPCVHPWLHYTTPETVVHSPSSIRSEMFGVSCDLVWCIRPGTGPLFFWESFGA